MLKNKTSFFKSIFLFVRFQVMVREARCMLILPLKRCRLQLKGKQYAGTEFLNVAIHGKKLLATSVPPACLTNVHISEGQTMCNYVHAYDIHRIELFQC